MIHHCFHKSTLAGIVLFIVLLITGVWAYTHYGPQNTPQNKQLRVTPSQNVGTKINECFEKSSCRGFSVTKTMCANPSSVFCTCMGGISSIQDTTQGQKGICLISGKEYDEWEYFRMTNKITPEPEIDIENKEMKCGGWDTSGEIVCSCSGMIIKSECSEGKICDSGTYTCKGSCGSCCFKGLGNTTQYPSCDMIDSTQITQEELNRGWYWGTQDQKKQNTPSSWIYNELGRSSCWHNPEISCTFSP